jgi:type VI secretion system protein ImpF
MPIADDDVRSVPSILDRLMDDAENDRMLEHFGLRALKWAVARDLEVLLNTRQELLVELPADFVDLRHSLLTYGLPDFTALNLASQNDRNRVRRSLEQAVAMFEPRLERVRVSVEAPRPFDRGLRFRIDAVLRVEPAPEPVTFDAVLQLATQECRVEGQA